MNHLPSWRFAARAALAGLALLLAGVVPAWCEDQPDWAAGAGKSAKYPAAQFLTGYGCSKDADLEKAAPAAEAAARAALAGIFETRVNAVLDSEEQNRNGQDTQYVRSSVSAFSTLKLLGVKVERYDDRRAATVHALAVMNVREAARTYAGRAAQLRRAIAGLTASAKDAESRGDAAQAAKIYESAYPHFAELEEAEAVLLVVGGARSDTEEGPAVDRAAVTAAIERLLARRCESVDALAAILAHRLAAQVGARRVVVAPFTYRDTDFTSEFSRFLATAMAAKLAGEKVGATAADGMRLRSSDAGHPAAGALAVTGSYQDKGDEIRVFAYAVDPATGDRLGTADSAIAAAVVAQEGLALKPANAVEAMADQKVFGRGDIVSGGLAVQAWTTRGDRNLALRRGATYKILVRVNQPAHIRLVYHLATKQRVLVSIVGRDGYDYFIDASKVNKVVELPQDYEVMPPFGAEVLQVLASTTPLPAVRTAPQTIDGVPYEVLAEDLAVALPKMRGIGLANPSAAAPVAETRVTVTTMP
jgi:hypothetical protein